MTPVIKKENEHYYRIGYIEILKIEIILTKSDSRNYFVTAFFGKKV